MGTDSHLDCHCEISRARRQGGRADRRKGDAAISACEWKCSVGGDQSHPHSITTGAERRVHPEYNAKDGAAIRYVQSAIHLRFGCSHASYTVTLVSSAPEVQWVALRNINLILQKRPEVLSNEMRVFFCKYNDPSYVKLEKLEIMVKLSTEKNIDTLLSELKEYASEVDYDFVKRAIRAIGQCAIKIDAAAEKCVHVLLELIATRVSYVVQEAIIVIKDIFRKYPARYEGIIPTLCSNLEDLDEPEAKASLIWILGEYAEKIDNADEILGTFLDTFADEAVSVQLQTLTAIVKLYLKRPDSAQSLVQRVLQAATKGCDNPDIRDRAYVYWRLLSTDPEAAKVSIVSQHVVLALTVLRSLSCWLNGQAYPCLSVQSPQLCWRSSQTSFPHSPQCIISPWRLSLAADVSAQTKRPKSGLRLA